MKRTPDCILYRSDILAYREHWNENRPSTEICTCCYKPGRRHLHRFESRFCGDIQPQSVSVGLFHISTGHVDPEVIANSKTISMLIVDDTLPGIGTSQLLQILDENCTVAFGSVCSTVSSQTNVVLAHLAQLGFGSATEFSIDSAGCPKHFLMVHVLKDSFNIFIYVLSAHNGNATEIRIF